MLDILVLQALSGISLPISKFLLQFSSPLFLAGLRMFVGGCVAVLFYCVRYRITFTLKKEHWLLFVHMTLFGVYLKYVLRYWSLSHLPAAKLAFMLNGTPFIAALFSYFYFSEMLTKNKWLGLFSGFIGLLPLVFKTMPTETVVGQFLFFSWPECALLIAMVSHTYGMIIARKLIREYGYSVMAISGLRMVFGGGLALVTSLFFEGWSPVTSWTTFGRWFVVVIVVSNVICHSWYLGLVKKYSVTFISLTDYINPFCTAFYSWFFLKETITWHYGVSAVTVFIGLYLFYKDELKESRLYLQRV